MLSNTRKCRYLFLKKREILVYEKNSTMLTTCKLIRYALALIIKLVTRLRQLTQNYSNSVRERIVQCDVIRNRGANDKYDDPIA